MVRIPDSTIDQIRSQTSIKEIVSQYIDLKKSGQNHFGHCPFHEDNTPSFSVNEDKQIFKCFSCNRGGNVFTFIQEIEDLSFVKAVLKVAEMSQIEIDPTLRQAINQNEPSRESVRGKLITIHEHAKNFYQHILLNAEVGEQAYDYLEGRGISRELMEEFQLGYSPRQRESISLYLNTVDDLPVDDQLLEATGLFSNRQEDDESFKDRFFNRIIFPLKNHQGHTVGFSGRIFEDNQDPNFHTAKYLNSPETRIFNKRQLLYNFDKAKKAIRQSKETVLFEGYMDVIAGWQAGIKNGVASMGTSLTNEHIQAIENASDTIVLAFDGDNAGVNSTKKTAEFLNESSQLKVEIVSFPKGQDPDDYLKTEGAEAFHKLINHGRKTLFQFLKDYYKNQYNLNNESDRIKFIERMIQEIAKIPSAVERDLEANKLAEEFEISPDSIKSQVQTLSTERNQTKVNTLQKQRHFEPIELTNKVSKKSKIDQSQEKLLNRLFNYPESLTYLNNFNEDFEFQTSDYQLIYLLFQEYMAKYETIDGFIDYAQDDHIKRLISNILWIQLNVEPTELEIHDFANYISNIYPLEKRINDIKQEIEEEQQRGNYDRAFQLINESINLNKKLKA